MYCGMSTNPEELVTSSCLCKKLDGAGFPFQVESLEDGVDDAVHTFHVHKAHHGPSAAAHFHEAALDHVGGTQLRHRCRGKAKNDSSSAKSRPKRFTTAG